MSKRKAARWVRGAAYVNQRQCAAATVDDDGRRHVCSQRLDHGGWHMDPAGYAWSVHDDGAHVQFA